MKTIRSVLLACTITLGMPLSASADEIIKIIVPFGAAGTQDLVARIIAPTLAKELGARVVVDNRSGAGGTLGTATVSKSAPDGKTLLLASSNHNINAFLYPTLSYNPLTDFKPVAHVGTTAFMLITGSGVPAATASEFVEYAKQRPGTLNYASAGNGSGTHLGMASFSAAAGIDLQHIPFKGTNEIVNEIMAGRIQAAMPAVINVVPFMKDHRIRVLGISSANRASRFPEIPTLKESGFNDFIYDTWIGLLAPAGTPEKEVSKINQAMHKVLADPSVTDSLLNQGIEPKAMDNDAFSTLLSKNYEEMRAVVDISKAKVD